MDTSGLLIGRGPGSVGPGVRLGVRPRHVSRAIGRHLARDGGDADPRDDRACPQVEADELR